MSVSSGISNENVQEYIEMAKSYDGRTLIEVGKTSSEKQFPVRFSACLLRADALLRRSGTLGRR